MKIKLLILVLGLLLPTISTATIYQWKDAQGETHFSQEPPTNTNATIVNPKFAPAKPSPSHEVEKKAPAKTAEKETEKQGIDPKVVEEMAINCERAKVHLKDIESKPRIRLQDASGNVNFLTDEERNLEIVKTKEAISKYCVGHK